MLKRRLIPKLLIGSTGGPGGRPVLVTTVKFDRRIPVGDPVAQARIYEAQMVDELAVIDIDAAPNGRTIDLDLLSRIASEVFMPISVGGGIRTVDQGAALIQNGADKIIINTGRVLSAGLIRSTADRLGSQAVVAGIDYRVSSEGVSRVAVNAGSQLTDQTPVEAAVEAQLAGAGEVLLTAIDRDGSRCGLDIETSLDVVRAVDIPVVGGGGCGAARDFIDGFRLAELDGVASGTYFALADQSPMQIRSQVSNAGIPVRLRT